MTMRVILFCLVMAEWGLVIGCYFRKYYMFSSSVVETEKIMDPFL